MANPARATTTNLGQLGLSPSAWSTQVSTSTQQAALNAASDLLDGYLAAQFDLPILAPYPQDVIEFECIVASYRLLANRGYNPATGADPNILEQYQQKLRWAEAVSRGEIVPNIVDSSTDASLGGPFVITSAQRGFSERGVNVRNPPAPQVDPFSGD